mmetsp:Transcript_45886/g.137110  ORF Transcript_45886/g.137110 Transcript_45886/m.137110 type:complete len:216 (+) Transcript_45886:295-942(+)
MSRAAAGGKLHVGLALEDHHWELCWVQAAVDGVLLGLPHDCLLAVQLGVDRERGHVVREDRVAVLAEQVPPKEDLPGALMALGQVILQERRAHGVGGVEHRTVRRQAPPLHGLHDGADAIPQVPRLPDWVRLPVKVRAPGEEREALALGRPLHRGKHWLVGGAADIETWDQHQTGLASRGRRRRQEEVAGLGRSGRSGARHQAGAHAACRGASHR